MVKVNGTEREYRPGMSVLQLLEEMGYSITRVAMCTTHEQDQNTEK